MSLDVYLIATGESTCSKCGHVDRLPVDRTVYTASITHNLGRMAKAAGIYEALWRPDEIDATHARDLIGLLTEGLDRLRSDPVAYLKLEAANGWGLYVHFVPFVERYLAACVENPDAEVIASR